MPHAKKSSNSLLSIDDLSNKDIQHILDLAQQIEKKPHKFADYAKGKILSLLFFEPSTRTYFSFASAIQRLGGSVIGFPNAETTSIAKGESLEDTARMMSSYSDIMAVRSGVMGSMQRMSQAIHIPLINAGEGQGEHPTQALTDLYTIRQSCKKLNVTIAFYGDLKFGRTNHSLIKAIARFGAKIICIAPPELQMPKDYVALARKAGAEVILDKDIKKYVKDIDVLYVSRLQKERLPARLNYAVLKKAMNVDLKLVTALKSSAIVMHPLPRVDEIAVSVDTDKRAKYFQQAANAVPVRMAILLLKMGYAFPI